MSNLLAPVDPTALEAVTGGGASRRGDARDPLIRDLTTLSATLKDLGKTAKATGFSMTEILMLGLLMNQRRGAVQVFVPRPYC